MKKPWRHGFGGRSRAVRSRSTSVWATRFDSEIARLRVIDIVPGVTQRFHHIRANFVPDQPCTCIQMALPGFLLKGAETAASFGYVFASSEA
jgi:hypothetical protein